MSIPRVVVRPEILVEFEPPLVSISHARAERESHLQKVQDDAAFKMPPKQFYTRRHLRPNDQWHIELTRAADEGKSEFFLQLIVSLQGIRRDLYAVSEVSRCYPFPYLLLSNIPMYFCWDSYFYIFHAILSLHLQLAVLSDSLVNMCNYVTLAGGRTCRWWRSVYSIQMLGLRV